MKKTWIAWALLLAVLLGSICSAYAADTVLITSIAAETPSLLLAPGTQWEIVTVIMPPDATIQTLAWESSDTKVAEVSDYGIINAKTVGNCSIIGNAMDGSGKHIVISVQVKEHDIVILEPGNMKVDIDLLDNEGFTMGVTDRGAFQDSYKMSTESEKGCVVRVSNSELRPVKAGSDILHIKEVHNKKTTRDDKYTVFVSQAAVREEGAVPSKDADGGILFRDIPWGSTYKEVAELLSKRGEKVKKLVARKGKLWTQIEGEVTFGNFIAYNNGLSFNCDSIDPENPASGADDCSFVMGDYYFDPEIPFSALKQNLVRAYGLSAEEPGGSDTECTWKVGNVTLQLKGTQKYSQLKISNE